MSTRTHRLVIAAAAAATGGSFAQPDLASIDPEGQLREQIAAIRAEGGPTPVGLLEPLRALALVYEESGEHAAAVVAVEEARYIARVHRGLSSADEALLLRQQLRSEKALGDPERVWDIEQDMVTIARQHHDDIRMVPIFREMAEDRLGLIDKVTAGQRPPMLYLGCYYSQGLRRYDDTRGEHAPPDGVCHAGGSGMLRFNLGREALMYYADAIEVIVKNGGYASQELRELEKEAFGRATFASGPFARQRLGTTALALDTVPPTDDVLEQILATQDRFACSWTRADRLEQLLASEIIGSCLEPVLVANGVVEANVGGWVSLVRLLAYEIRSEAPAAARANAITDLADWQLLATPPERRRFAQLDQAFRLYEQAYRELEQDAEARASMFSPEVPVTFAPNRFTSAATAGTRYIDVSFAITKDGWGEQIKILATSTSAIRSEQRDLVRLIEGTRFRPRFVDGKLADAAPVTVRYPLGP
jgi:hypothetical protein